MKSTTDQPMSATTGTAVVPHATPRIWAYVDHQGAAHAVACPAWCENDHEMDQYLTTPPEDITHQAYGQEAIVWAAETPSHEQRSLLHVQLAVAPDATHEEAERRVPHVMVELLDGVWSRPMGPGELAEFIGAVEGQLAELRTMHARLTAARAEHRGAR